MFKVIATLCFVGAIIHVIDNPFGNTPSVQAATTNITSTTGKVQQAAGESKQKAAALGTALQNHDAGIPARLKEFMTSTERLTTLRERLLADIRQYDDAATEAFKKFDTEAQSIKDPGITRNMTILRRKTEEDQNDRKREATETVSLLDDVLLKGNDLQHAANCVMIATSLHDHGETLDTQIADARTTATAYEATTNTLLNNISTVLAQK